MPIKKTSTYRYTQKAHPLARQGNEAGEDKDMGVAYGSVYINVDGKAQKIGQDSDNAILKGITGKFLACLSLLVRKLSPRRG